MKKYRIFASALLLCCYLGLYDGHIALWKNGETSPEQVFPYSAELLPQADRQALEKGIPCPTKEELNRLLEDYLS